MIDSMIIGASATIGLSIGGLGLRDVFARAAIKKACAAAAANVAQFKQDNTYVAPLKDKFKAFANVLYETISQSREMRDSHVAEAKKLVIPNPNVPMELEKLQEALVSNKKLFVGVMKNTYTHKVKNLLMDQIQLKTDIARGVAAKVAAAKAAGEALPPEEVAKLYAEIKEKLDPHLDAFQKTIADAIDQTGLTDIVVEKLEKFHDLVAKNVGNAAAEHMDGAHHFFSALHHIPGAGILLNTGKKEWDLLKSGEVDLEDAVGNLAGSFMIRAPFTKVGMVLDGLTGGMSMGAFTVLLNFVSKKVVNGLLESDLKGLKEEFNRLKTEIEEALHEALRAINKVAGNLQTELVQRIENCPDINKEAFLNEFMDELKNAVSVSLGKSEEILTKNTQEAIDILPANNWVDKVLFIDRRKAVEKLYLQAQREISSHHAGLVHNFYMAADSHAGDAVRFLLDQVLFDTAEIDNVLENMAEMIEKSAPAYAEQLSVWQKETDAFHAQSIETINKVSEKEIAAFNAFSEARKATMKSIRRRIAVNEKRQGKVPAPQPVPQAA